MRAPFRGFFPPYSLRIFISPGISLSATSIALRPVAAKLISALYKVEIKHKTAIKKIKERQDYTSKHVPILYGNFSRFSFELCAMFSKGTVPRDGLSALDVLFLRID